MDYKGFVDFFKPMTCILSVEKNPDGSCGTIRYAAGNPPYISSIEDPEHVSSSEMLNNKFVPGSEYTRYIPKDLTFENMCYSAAILGRPSHTCSRPERYPFWLNVFILPLVSDDPNIGYCSYTLEIFPVADDDLMSSRSADTISDVLKTCFKLRASGDLEKNIDSVVADIGAICDSDHCCILLTDKQNKSCRVFGEFIREGSGMLPMKAYLDDSFFSITESWPATIAGSTCFVAKDKAGLSVLQERNPIWYASLTGAGVSSIVLFPLKYNGETLGYMWAINFNTENAQKIIETLELSTFFIAAEISNYLLVDKLRIMSSVDLLTGVYNRNAMNTRIDEIVNGGKHKKATGIIFTDINGLKYTNDHEGHNAGDRLIRSAAELIRKHCPDAEIFRAGGDEFMIIVNDTPKDKFENMVESLKSPENGVYLAVGSYFNSDQLDVRTAMHIADEQMYIDKERYYKQFPDHRR